MNCQKKWNFFAYLFFLFLFFLFRDFARREDHIVSNIHGWTGFVFECEAEWRYWIFVWIFLLICKQRQTIYEIRYALHLTMWPTPPCYKWSSINPYILMKNWKSVQRIFRYYLISVVFCFWAPRVYLPQYNQNFRKTLDTDTDLYFFWISWMDNGYYMLNNIYTYNDYQYIEVLN